MTVTPHKNNNKNDLHVCVSSPAYTGSVSGVHVVITWERISFKLVVLTYRAIHAIAPTYLQSCFTGLADMTSRRRLRSSASQRLAVPPFVSLLSASGRSQYLELTYGTVYHLTSHLYRLSRSSGRVSSYFYSQNHTRIFIFDSTLPSWTLQ